MGLIIFWVLLSLGVGWAAAERKLGFGSGFLLSLILSPLIGFVITLCYPMKEKPSDIVKPSATIINTTSSLADELEKLHKLREGNHLSEEEYLAAKSKLISK